jgi:archaellum biogenesis ATPase FlaH
MSVDLIQEIAKNKFLLILLEEKEYPAKLEDIIRSIERTKTKVCYVCLSSTYEDVLSWMSSAGIDSQKFYFIDTMTRYYEERVSNEKCFFVSSPSSLDEIKEVLLKAIKERGYEIVIFDAISSLLEYKDLFSILKFTHALMTEDNYAKAKKLYIVMSGDSLPEKESKKLVSDLRMFADGIVEIPASLS